MTEITLNDDQARILASSADPVIVRDRQGNVIGRIEPTESGDDLATVAEAKRRLASDQPRYTTAEVLEHLDSLESE